MIPINEHELITDHMIKKCKNFMEHVEAKIGNAKHPMFDVTDHTECIIVIWETPKMPTTTCYLMDKRSKTRKRLKLTMLTLKHYITILQPNKLS